MATTKELSNARAIACEFFIRGLTTISNKQMPIDEAIQVAKDCAILQVIASVEAKGISFAECGTFWNKVVTEIMDITDFRPM